MLMWRVSQEKQWNINELIRLEIVRIGQQLDNYVQNLFLVGRAQLNLRY